MTEHRIGTQEERQAERDALLKKETELARRNDGMGTTPWGWMDKRPELRTMGRAINIYAIPPDYQDAVPPEWTSCAGGRKSASTPSTRSSGPLARACREPATTPAPFSQPSRLALCLAF
jgi:hypothetical protein